MTGAPDYDVIVVGAGHNGLAATALLAKRGFRVLCLEKNAYVGGMAGTREILSGCRNDVGASLLFPLWTMIDGPRRGLRGTWIYFTMSLVTSFGFAMGMYLAAQERQVRWLATRRA